MAAKDNSQSHMKASSSSEVAPTSQLSHSQLVAASLIIPLTKKDKLGRELGLNQADLDQVRSLIQQYETLVQPGEEILRILETWKEKFPLDCTLETLLKALTVLDRDAAEKVEKAITNGLELLENDEHCNNTIQIDDVMIRELTKILPTNIWTSLGSLLGLTRDQIDTIAVGHEDDFTYNMLKRWKENKGKEAVIGELYKALQLIGNNNTADQVIKIGEKYGLEARLC